jgi:hypothetical protein
LRRFEHPDFEQAILVAAEHFKTSGDKIIFKGFQRLYTRRSGTSQWYATVMRGPCTSIRSRLTLWFVPFPRVFATICNTADAGQTYLQLGLLQEQAGHRDEANVDYQQG